MTTTTSPGPTTRTRLGILATETDECATACPLKNRCELADADRCPKRRRPPQPVARRPRPEPREDEWSRGRMKGVTKPSWGGKFASKMRGESGMSTAEYAVGTLAAVAFAGVLLKVLTSGTVQSALSNLIERALS
nr:DUF4244 domain-containing protein [Glycomyces xiaoerkulensis]